MVFLFDNNAVYTDVYKPICEALQEVNTDTDTYIQQKIEGTTSSKQTYRPVKVQNINTHTQKQTPWPLVRERTIPTERPPLVDEI
jgi:hypothetical protein